MRVVHYDLPDDFVITPHMALDTETMGLQVHRDRLCAIQCQNDKGDVVIIHFPKPHYDQSPRLITMLINPKITKIFHYARFDVGVLQYAFNIVISAIYCTKIASYLCRTYTSKHSLKDLCEHLLGVTLSKTEQMSDWGAETLTAEQQTYAAYDVAYLHGLKKILDGLLVREKRMEIAEKCFEFLPTRATLDTLAGQDFDIFRHRCYGI